MITSGFQVGRTGFHPDGKEKGKVENAKNGDAEKGIPQHIPKKMANQELSKELELKEGKNEKKRKWDLPSDGYRTCSVYKREKQENQRFPGKTKNSIIKGRDGLRRKDSEKREKHKKRRDFLDKLSVKSVVKRKY